MTKKQRVWNERWVQGEPVGEGGQANTYLATDVSSDSPIYVIKVLKSQRDPERRARMYREVAAYETLSHQGIPKIIDSNVQLYKDETKPLYLVLEYIPGPNLEDHISSTGPMSLEQALVVMDKLIDIIEYCHEKGLVHRDIKPDNVLLKEGDINSIFLIDFGISFNEQGTTSTPVTEDEQHLGNRFLFLPEQRGQGISKRDSRTDITACCGLLFYLLTSGRPTSLTDEHGRKPHQRPKANELLSLIPPEQREKLYRIFDIGFETHIDRRYQSSAALRQDLAMVTMTTEVEQTEPESKLTQFKERQASDPQYKMNSEIEMLFKRLDNLLQHTVGVNVREALGPGFSSTQTGYGSNFETLTHHNQVGIKSNYSPEKQIWPEFTFSITGSEVVITATEGDERTEILRGPYSSFNRDEDFARNVRDYFFERLDRLS
jgi:serine/threonine protein kinase